MINTNLKSLALNALNVSVSPVKAVTTEGYTLDELKEMTPEQWNNFVDKCEVRVRGRISQSGTAFIVYCPDEPQDKDPERYKPRSCGNRYQYRLLGKQLRPWCLKYNGWCI